MQIAFSSGNKNSSPELKFYDNFFLKDPFKIYKKHQIVGVYYNILSNYLTVRLMTILIVIIPIILFISHLGVFCIRVKYKMKVKRLSETLLASGLRCVPSVSRENVYLARLSWWLSWLDSCTRLPRGSPGPRLSHWRWLEYSGGWGGEVDEKKEDAVTEMKRKEGNGGLREGISREEEKRRWDNG